VKRGTTEGKRSYDLTLRAAKLRHLWQALAGVSPSFLREVLLRMVADLHLSNEVLKLDTSGFKRHDIVRIEGNLPAKRRALL
jgi:hypothetical protein